MIRRKHLLAASSAVIAVIAFTVMTMRLGIKSSLFIVPIIILLPVCIMFQSKERRLKCPPETILNEAPTAIGMMAVTLSSGGSFDTAIRDVAWNGPKNISDILKRIVLDADCRRISDIKKAVIDEFSSFPKELSPFKRAIHMVITAFESNDPNERTGMMKDAENIILEGLRSMGETYSSGLNSPCMLIFGLGIMLPMILISMLPMLSIGGLFSVPFIDSDMVTVIVLAVIPAFVGAIVFSLLERNPFHKVRFDGSEVRFITPLLSAIPLFFVFGRIGLSDEISLSLGLIISGIIAYILLSSPLKKEKERARLVSVLDDSLFELGNRLSMGENFEIAIKKTFGSRKDCIQLFNRIERELTICRGDIEFALTAVLSEISPKAASDYRDIYRASMCDVRNAGRLATNLAHQRQDQNNVRKSIENKLKSTMDMMTGTSAIFAPIILGMSVVMLGPISDITGSVFFDDIGLKLIFYLVELAALISLMTTNLMFKGGSLNVISRFCLMMPVSLVVFMACSVISI